MTNADSTELIPGDEFTLTITGKITSGTKADTPAATTLRINRPGMTTGLYGTGPGLGTVRVDAIFEPNAEIKYEIKSQHKNGVHIDSAGRFWMRRPDGWYEMTIAPRPVPNIRLGTRFTPPGVQRLKEDKEK